MKYERKEDVNLLKKYGLSSFSLKWIALLCMFCSHIYVAILINIGREELIGFNIIGRIAFPIFCFLLVEGYYYSHNRSGYLLRLFVFAVISEIPFDMAVYGTWISMEKQNVFFTLFIGLLLLCSIHAEKNSYIRVFYALPAMLIAEMLHTDYGAFGIWMILCFDFFRERKEANLMMHIGNQTVLGSLWFGMIQSYAGIAAIPLYLYNGTRGKAMKLFFYYAYPVHLFLLGLIRIYIL